MDLVSQLVTIVVAGAAAGGAAALVRALPWPQSWKERKPLGCPTCSGGWMAMLSVGYLTATGRAGGGFLELGFTWLGASIVAAVLNAVALPPPPVLPDLFKEQDP